MSLLTPSSLRIFGTFFFLGTFNTPAVSLLTYPVMTYDHVLVEPQLSPARQADFAGLADSPRFADYPEYADSLELKEFFGLVDFL